MLLDKPIKEEGWKQTRMSLRRRRKRKQKRMRAASPFFISFFFYVVNHFELGALCGFIIYVYV